MNAPLRRITTVVMLMFFALIGAVTWVQFVQARALNNDARNVRILYREYGKDRGSLVVAGTPIARSVPVDDSFGYQREYPQGELYSAVTGFYSIANGRAGMEAGANDLLTGQADSLFWSRIGQLVTGKQPTGSTVELTINPAAQQAARDALGDQVGAVVAIDPRTGAILAMVSTPGFDPNALAIHSSSQANAAYQALIAAPNNPLENKAIKGPTYPPGSTFKLVVAAAALESGAYTPDSVIAAPRELTLPGSTATLTNHGGYSCSPTGQMTLADALRISCNTAFGQLGMDLGDDAIAAQAAKFGFDSDSLMIPMRVTASHVPTGLSKPETAQAAIGQNSVMATPLQMAMVSAAIANGGTLMTPYLISTVQTADLEVIEQTKPKVLSQAISPTTAQSLTSMMVGVVNSGTGKAAQIPGVQVAGKTGTAENVPGQAPHAWFTAFAPADNPQIAVAVLVEHGGNMADEATGGAVAAPIARAVMQAVLP